MENQFSNFFPCQSQQNWSQESLLAPLSRTHRIIGKWVFLSFVLGTLKMDEIIFEGAFQIFNPPFFS